MASNKQSEFLTKQRWSSFLYYRSSVILYLQRGVLREKKLHCCELDLNVNVSWWNTS